MTIAGPVAPVLHVATSGTDADFVVKLIDVFPDDAPNWPGDTTGFVVAGYQQLVRGEPFRGRYRRDPAKPVAFVPNQPDSLRFAMPDINHTFKKGHRIMVQIQSSWFPLTDRNPQTFVPNIFEAKPSDFKSATMRVYHTRSTKILVSRFSAAVRRPRSALTGALRSSSTSRRVLAVSPASCTFTETSTGFRGPSMGTNVVPADAGSDRGVYDSLEALRSLLIEGERIEASAVQRRLFALRHRRIMVAATTGRLIIVQRGLFGGFNPIDVRWQDLRDATLSVGDLRRDAARCRVSQQRSGDVRKDRRVIIVIPGLRKLEAQEVYRACQTRAQAWREKRRIRELEELRAKAGGIQIGGAARSRVSARRRCRRRRQLADGAPSAREGNAAERSSQRCRVRTDQSQNPRRAMMTSLDVRLAVRVRHSRSLASPRRSLSATTLSAQTPDSATLAALRWRSIGPVNMAGRITDVEGDPKNPKTFYVDRRHRRRVEDDQRRHDVHPAVGSHADRIDRRHRDRAERSEDHLRRNG